MARVPALLAALLLVPALAAAETVIVEMTTVDGEPRFLPADVTVREGDVVRWVNTDPYLEHSVCSGTGSADPRSGDEFSSPLLRLGEYFEHEFLEAGEFEYYSIPHEYEGMFGIVRVNRTTSVGGQVEESTWGLIKQKFSDFLPRS